jgi:glycoside/pentoside/hexuronide:cation symporter, GPH family
VLRFSDVAQTGLFRYKECSVFFCEAPMTDQPVSGAPEYQDGKALNFWQKFTYSFGNVGVNLAPGIVMNWMIFYYMGRPVAEGSEQKIILVSAAMVAAMNFLGRLVDAVADPLVGYYSDRWQTRWGRRIPWVMIGTPFLAFFTAMIFFPPHDHHTLANTLWLGIGLSGIWFFYTVVVAPYLSLLPEITPYRDERVNLSTYMAYFDVVGMLLGSIVLGILITRFAGGLDIGPIHLGDGYKVASVFTVLVMSICFYVSVIKIREKPAADVKPVKINFITAAKECHQNPAFWPYILCVTFLRLGIDVLVASIPFLVVWLMGYGEDVAGILQGVIVLTAALFFPLTAKVSNKLGKKKAFSIALVWFAAVLPILALVHHAPFLGHMVSGIVGLFGVEMTIGQIKLAHCIVLFVSLFYPISASLVLPRAIYADVMDLDEKRTGLRREAMYNGMEGLITKFAAGIAGAMVPLMVAYLGGTTSKPWGILAAAPVCSVFLILGWYSFRKHPIDY